MDKMVGIMITTAPCMGGAVGLGVIDIALSSKSI